MHPNRATIMEEIHPSRRKIVPATELAKYPFNVRTPANELHITPGVSQNSLLSTVKYADANYITVFDKDKVNIYDANDTVVTVSKGAILRGWFCFLALHAFATAIIYRPR